MKHTLTLLIALLLAPLGALHAEPPADSVLLDQNTFGTTTHELPQNDYGLGVNSTSNPLIPQRGGRFWTFTADPKKLKRDANGLPSAYWLGATRPGDGYVGWLIVVPEAENFRMKIAVANVKAPYVDLRWRHDEGKRKSGGPLLYHFDFVSGTLTKEAYGKSTLLAQSKVPLMNIVAQTVRPPTPLKWKEFEILVQNGKIQVWAVADNKKLQEVLQCEDADPIPSGAIKLGEGQFGDVRVEALPDTFKSRRLAAQGPEFEDALATSMENARMDDRLKALDFLRHLATPVPREVLTALAIAKSDKELGIRLAALRTIKTLNLNLDVPALLLDGLSSDSATVRAGAARVLNNLKLPPAQMQAKVVDALMKGDSFARFNVKRINESAGEPLQAAVYAEIQQRYAKATNPQVKIALLKAMSRDCITLNSHKQPIKDDPRPEALPLLAQALGDSSAEVRLTAMRTLRFLESPLYFVDGKSKGKENIFSNNPEPTAKIVKSLQSILQSDPSAAQRAEAVGCLAEMRQVPETVIAALGDKDASVRSAAAQGLCCYARPLLQAAIPSLQKLTTDAACGKDAVATLGYIQNEELQALMKDQKTMTPLKGLSPAEMLEESSRRVERGAKASLALQAERIPVPNDFISHYSAQLCLDRNREGANARLRQCLQPYAFGEGFGFLDGTKLPLVYALHYSKSPYYPRTFTPETEELFKKTMFSLIDWSSKDVFKDYVKDVDLLAGTENMHVQINAGVWTLMLTQLNEDPAYASRRLRGGKTVAEYSAEWNAYMKKWMRTRALNGFWVELGSRYAGVYSTPGILAIYTATTDPELKQLTKMFLDLSLVENAQACIGDMRGGSKNRIKDNEIRDAMKTINNAFVNGSLMDGKGCHVFSSTDYRAPAVAKLLYILGQYPEQPIVIANRRLGEVRNKLSKASADEPKPADNASDDSKDNASTGSKDNDGDDSDDDSSTDSWLRWVSDSKAVNTMYKTRNYLLGSMLRDPKTVMGVLYNQRAWNGLLFADGKGLYPTCPWMVPYFCFQHKNVLIVQRDKPDPRKVPVGLSFSPGLEIVEENGWVFFIHGDAYAGVRFLTGGYTLQNEMTKEKADGRTHTLLAKVQTTPILIEAGDKDAFGSFDAFKAAVQANTLTFSDNKVEYSGPKQPRIEYFLESTGQVSKVDGKPFSIDPVFVYSGPYMQRKEGESVVTVTVAGKRVHYDFDKATITEAGSSK